MKKLALICLLLALLPMAALAEMPEWEYPLAPEILDNHEGYITLTNRAVLLSSDYEPDDLVNVTARKGVTGQLRQAANDALNRMFAAAEEAQWMYEHCQEFGFVLRYMEDKEESTGINFEPWHFRYVGEEAAQYIMAQHLSLEEFTAEWQAYVADWEARGGDFDALIKERARINEVTVIDTDDEGEEEVSFFY